MGFSYFILLFLFFMQILLLNYFYEIYKTNQLNDVINNLKTTKDLDVYKLEDIAYEYGICISVYHNGSINIISNMYNQGCLIGDSKTGTEYVKSFVESGKTESTTIFNNNRFNNKTLVRALKYNDDVYIFLNSSIQPFDASIRLLKSQFLYISIIIFSISLIIGYFISRLISKPIVDLSSQARRLAEGNFNVKFSTDSKIEEIRELASTFDLAKNELSKTDELRRDLLANVGHDLKTPLTMIKAYAEMIKDFENMSVQKRNENLNIIIEETDRLNILVSDILDLSKLQSDTYELKIEEFDLDKLIRDVIKRYYILIDSEGYQFVYDNEDPIMVMGDKKRIEQVIYNLINNAINYTGDDKTVYINLVNEKKKVIVKIRDTGKGIKKEDIKYIWNKYYHNEKKHKRNAVGTGLGLSIVKTILDSHNFKYGVDSKINKGTTFYFEINKTNKNTKSMI